MANIFQGPDHANFKNYENVAGAIDDVPFGVIYNPEVAASAEVEMNKVVIFKQVYIYVNNRQSLATYNVAALVEIGTNCKACYYN